MLTFVDGFLEAKLMVTSTNQPIDRVNTEQSALEDGMAEFCNLLKSRQSIYIGSLFIDTVQFA